MLFLWSYPRRTPQALEIKKQIMKNSKLSEYKDLTIFALLLCSTEGKVNEGFR
jgi:hypothetical protein